MKNNLRLPAEWELQSGVLLAWPPVNDYWRPVLADVRQAFFALAREIAEDQKLLLICEDRKLAEDYFKEQDINLSNIQFFEIPINDVWTRDYGPITVLENDKPVLLNFKFNAWGNKYSMPLDNAVCEKLNNFGAFNSPLKKLDIILEGGSIESDGAGTLLTTARCLLNSNRNATASSWLEENLKTHLGINKILWLEHGFLCGDDTDAHIDTLARFCNKDTICYQACDDATDEHYSELQKMAVELTKFRTAENNPYHLIALPWPKAQYSRVNGERLPASYANFLITNKKILLPTYNDPADQKALQILQKCFPDRKIVGIDARAIIEGFGSIHCVTMQLPQEVLSCNH